VENIAYTGTRSPDRPVRSELLCQLLSLKGKVLSVVLLNLLAPELFFF
jgi:hypothetical protein